jgi:hypothetical protein
MCIEGSRARFLLPGEFQINFTNQDDMSPIPPDDTSVRAVAQTIQLAVAPVFMLGGVGAFLNVCATRVSRIVDRCRKIEPLLFQSKGATHGRALAELKTLDRRMQLVSWATFLSVLSAILICTVVDLLFAANLFETHFGPAIAWLFIGSMIAIGAGFAVFLVETRLAVGSLRVRPEVLAHTPDEP